MENSNYICQYCGRLLPNEELLTGTKCVWCDTDYWKQNNKPKQCNLKKKMKKYYGLGLDHGK